MTDSATANRASATPTLAIPHWHAVPEHCGQTRPGVGHDNPRVMDLSDKATTPDQVRIEETLAPLLTPATRLLHVGVGNSSLARRFASRVALVEGITVNEQELAHAQSLGLDGYRVSLCNKYSPELARIPGPFDLIVDNNLSSFACCLYHFQVMLDTYVRLLGAGGRILTDRQGMAWCYENGPMTLTESDLRIISTVYPFEVEALTDQVFALRLKDSW